MQQGYGTYPYLIEPFLGYLTLVAVAVVLFALFLCFSDSARFCATDQADA